jgi:autotransporter-associated beta strand protein
MKTKTSVCLCVLGLMAIRVHAVTISKANNTDNLDQPTSWVGGVVPGSSDTAQWDNVVTGPNATVLGSDLNWGTLRIADPGGDVTIGGANTLTLSGASVINIDLGAATRDLTFNCPLMPGSDNVWDVGAARVLTLNGALIGGSSLTKIGAGTLVLNGNNSGYAGLITVTNGVVIAGHDNALGDSGATLTLLSTGASALYLNGGVNITKPLTINGAAVTGVTAKGNLRSLAGSNTWAGMISGNAAPRIGAEAGSTLVIAGGINLGTTTARTPTFVGPGHILVNSIVSNAGSGAGGLGRRLSTGTVTLTAANTYKGTTDLYDGVTVLDYDFNSENNILPDVSGLQLTGGTLELKGGSTIESVASTTVGVSGVGGASTLARSSGTSVIQLHAITRNTGATVNFGAVGIATTDTGNVNGILGGYATVAGSDWAMNSTGASDGPILAYTSYQTATDPSLWGATDNVSLSGNPASAVATMTINSLRVAGAATVQIASGNTLTLASGGLLVTGTGAVTIAPQSGSATLVGRPSGDLVVHQYSSSDLTISATIANNGGATALAKSGPGRLVLTGANTYTGVTYVNQGILSISANNNLGDEAAGTGITFAGGTLQATATFALESGGGVKRNIGMGETARSTIEVTGANTLTIPGVISGRGWLTKTGTGTLVLTGANTYVGDTTVNAGALLVNGSLASGTFLTVASGGTLGGTGTVGSSVTVQPGGTLSPGTSIGTLSVGGNLVLAGSVRVEINKSVSPSNDLVNVTGSIRHTGGGTLIVTNLGPVLAPGDTFQVFNKPVVNGESLTISGGGATWTNRLALDGSIGVLSVSGGPPVAPATNLTIAVSGPSSRTLGAQGAASSPYYVYASTNVTLPMSAWWLIGVTNSDVGGLIQFVDTGATNAQRFYRLGQPAP